MKSTMFIPTQPNVKSKWSELNISPVQRTALNALVAYRAPDIADFLVEFLQLSNPAVTARIVKSKLEKHPDSSRGFLLLNLMDLVEDLLVCKTASDIWWVLQKVDDDEDTLFVNRYQSPSSWRQADIEWAIDWCTRILKKCTLTGV